MSEYEVPEGSLSFEGIDPAVLVHALYHGTRALGMGALHDNHALSVDDVRAAIEGRINNGRLYIDYLAGRPLKTSIDLERKFFTTRLYDRDAGHGAAQDVVESLRRTLSK